MNVIGTGLPERIRTTAVAMLGITTAAALALVLFLYQASWPIPSLGPLTLPRSGDAGIHGGVALNGAGSNPASPSAGGLVAASGSTSAIVVVPVSVTGTSAGGGSAAGNAGLGSGVGQGQGAGGGSQPATPSPATPVRQPGSANSGSEEAPVAEPAPVTTPVTQPTTSPEAPAIPAGEEPPIGGELPETEEPPLEEGEEPEGEEEVGEEAPEEEAAHPESGVSAVPLVE
ncbi:MAG TPA: hypothetical protein VMS11_10370 [Solirubrobacterales bacterium]|nr:hypothetical protein [Solirubrobacterales bacterium]